MRVEDITEFHVNGIANYEIRKAEREFDKRRDYQHLQSIMRMARQSAMFFASCLVYAIK